MGVNFSGQDSNIARGRFSTSYFFLIKQLGALIRWGIFDISHFFERLANSFHKVVSWARN